MDRSSRRASLAWSIVLSVTSPTPTQELVSTLGVAPLAREAACRNASLIDVDGDGDQDVLLLAMRTQLGSGSGRDVLMRNDGGGVFVDGSVDWLPAIASVSSAQYAAIGDVDGDGDQDVLVGASQRSALIYLNHGNRFVESWSRGDLRAATAGVTVQEFELVDLDADGDPDLMVVSPTGRSSLLMNDGLGQFVDVTMARMAAARGKSLFDALAVDIDGDADLDVLASGVDAAGIANIFVFVNDGQGAFADRTTNQMQGVTGGGLIDGADVDGDGDVDLVRGTWGTRQMQIFANDGVGRFSALASSRLPVAVAEVGFVNFIDIDGDADEDILVGFVDASRSRGLYLGLYRNNGRGTFSDDSHVVPGMPYPASRPAVGDVDGDLDRDFVLTSLGTTPRDETRVWWNLTRQAVIGRSPARVAGTLTCETISTPSIGQTHAAVPWLSTRRLPTPLTLPGLGAFWLDPATVIPGPAGPIDPKTGVWSFSVPVPYDFRLIGTDVFTQAAILRGAAPGQQELTGWWGTRIRHDRF